MADTYADDQVESSPPWLRQPLGAAWARALGSQKDWLADVAKQAVKARFPGKSIDRTNLLSWSRDYTNAYWQGFYGVKPTIATGILAPDGTYTAQRFTFPAAGLGGGPGGAYAGVIDYGTTQIPQTLTASIWVRLVSGSTANLHLGRWSNPPGLVPATGAWQRFSAICPPVGAGADSGPFAFYSSSVNGEVVEVWNSQSEVGPVATPDIFTTTQPVTVSLPDANSAPSDALQWIGEERGLPRGIAEGEAQYRARLIAAWEAWQWAGTPYGILRAFQLAGYPSVLIQCQSGKQYALGTGGTPSDLVISNLAAPVHLGGAPTELWSDIAVLVTQPWPSWWGGTAPADGSADQKTAGALVAKWKGAHNRTVSLKVIGGAAWGVGGLAWGAFTWGSGTITTWTPPSG